MSPFTWILLIVVGVETLVLLFLSKTNRDMTGKMQSVTERLEKITQDTVAKINETNLNCNNTIDAVKKESEEKINQIRNEAERKIDDALYKSHVEIENNNKECENKIKSAESQTAQIRAECNQRIANIISDSDKRIETEISMCQRRLEEADKKTEDKINTMRIECDKLIKEKEEYIESNRYLLADKSEKDLLIDFHLALSGFAKRIERLEGTNTSTAVIEQLENVSTDIQSIIDKINSDLNGISNAVQETIDEAEKGLEIKTNKLIDTLGGKVGKLESDINKQFVGIQKRLTSNDFEKKIEDINCGVNSLKDELLYNENRFNLYDMISSVHDELTSEDEDNDDYSSSYVDDNSDKINDIYDMVSNVSESVEQLKNNQNQNQEQEQSQNHSQNLFPFFITDTIDSEAQSKANAQRAAKCLK